MPHRLVLHVLPLNSFLNQRRLDLSRESELLPKFKPIGVSSWDDRYNLDGVLTYRSYTESELCDSYCQVFFNGAIEAVYASILKTKEGQKPIGEDIAFIRSIAYERYAVEAVERYFKGYKLIGLDAPIIISMALLGCKGAYLYTDYDIDDTPIDRDLAILPEVETNSLDEDIPTIMKPIFDAVWNACGHPRSYNYTENGIWNVRRIR